MFKKYALFFTFITSLLLQSTAHAMEQEKSTARSSTLHMDSNEPTPAPSPDVRQTHLSPCLPLTPIDLAKKAFVSMINPDDTIKASGEKEIFNQESLLELEFDKYFDRTWGPESAFFNYFLLKDKTLDNDSLIQFFVRKTTSLNKKLYSSNLTIEEINEVLRQKADVAAHFAYRAIQLSDCSGYLHAILLLKTFLEAKNQTVVLNKHTWHRLITAAMCLAYKMQIDKAVWNIDVWKHVDATVSKKDFNTMERLFLQAVEGSRFINEADLEPAGRNSKFSKEEATKLDDAAKLPDLNTRICIDAKQQKTIEFNAPKHLDMNPKKVLSKIFEADQMCQQAIDAFFDDYEHKNIFQAVESAESLTALINDFKKMNNINGID